MHHIWTEEEDQFLRDFAPGRLRNEIIDEFEERFGYRLNVSRFKNRLHKLNVHQGVRYCFEKGHIPHNKGKHYDPGGRSVLTRFKKGNVPKQHRPVGSERINVDGYIEIKVAEPNKWRLKHNLVYEEHFGKLTKNEVVIFLDQNRLNLDINNLFKVTRAELAQINKRRLLNKTENVRLTAILSNRLKMRSKNKSKKKGGKHEVQIQSNHQASR